MKKKMQLEEARYRAGVLVEMLEPYCERIEIAGSIRREKPEVGDIEIVAIPKMHHDMFGYPAEDHQLDTLDFEAHGIGKVIAGQHKHKKIVLPDDGAQLDLFIVTPPAQWGVQLMIRTGPEEFSHMMVTKRKLGGLLPSHLRVQGGAIWSRNHIIPTPEEDDVFGLLGIKYIEPRDRR